MLYRSYQHVERLGRDEVDGILNGTCSIQTKIDGTNGVIWIHDGELRAGSRRQELSIDNDNRGFAASVLNDQRYKKYLTDHPNRYLYGEWLVPHTIRYYNDDAWKHFYVFDVVEVDGENERYIPYKEYSTELDEYNIDYIPEIAELTNPTLVELSECLLKSHYLMGEDKRAEGIVIKNYEFKNRFGRTTWAKIISDEFLNEKSDKGRQKALRAEYSTEMLICEEYCTEATIRKEYSKILNDFPNAGRQEQIGRILNSVYETIIREDIVDYILKSKKCVIDFFALKKEIQNKVKEVLKDELF